MARLDQVIKNVVDIFLEYADEGGKKHRLSKDELVLVLEKEIQSPELKGAINADDIEEAMKLMDKNQDGEVTFHEFCRCVSNLAKSYYHKKTGRGDKKGRNKEQEAEPETTNP